MLVAEGVWEEEKMGNQATPQGDRGERKPGGRRGDQDDGEPAG